MMIDFIVYVVLPVGIFIFGFLLGARAVIWLWELFKDWMIHRRRSVKQ